MYAMKLISSNCYVYSKSDSTLSSSGEETMDATELNCLDVEMEEPGRGETSNAVELNHDDASGECTVSHTE